MNRVFFAVAGVVAMTLAVTPALAWLPVTLARARIGEQDLVVVNRPPTSPADLLLVQPVGEQCVTGLTLEATLQLTESVATMDVIRKHQWLFLRYLTGYEIFEDTALNLDETVDYHDALITTQLYAIVTNARRNAAQLCDPAQPQLPKACLIESVVKDAIASSGSRRGVHALKKWILKSDNYSTGPGLDAETRRFELSRQRWTKSLLVPPVVHYFATQVRTQIAKVTAVVEALQVYTKLFGEGVSVDKDLVEDIYTAVVLPFTASAAAPHGRMWCPIATLMQTDCVFPNARFGIVATRSKKNVSDDRDGGNVEVDVDDATRLTTDRVVIASIQGRQLRQGDPLRVCLAGDREAATPTNGLFVAGTSYPISALPKLTRRRRSFRPQADDGAEVAGEAGDPKRQQDLYFDVHLEMSPTPVAVDRGCLSAPLTVKGGDGTLTPLLMDCMVIQQLSVEEQSTYRSVVDGTDLQKKLDFLVFLQGWLRHLTAFNYSMPYVLTNPREDLTGPEHHIVTRPTVVPEWCVRPGDDPLEGDEIEVCALLHRVNFLIADAKDTFYYAGLRVESGIRYLEKEIEAGLPEMIQLRQETERRMLPIQKVLNHEGWSCSATWCGGGMLGLEDLNERPKLN